MDGRRVGGTVRGDREPLRAARLPDARLGGGGGRRRAGGLAAADPGGRRGVDNLAAWLRTVVSRVCLDMLRARRSRREEPVGDDVADRSRPTRIRGRRGAGRLGRPGVARRAGHARARPSGSRSCCTTCSPCRSTRSRRCWAAPRSPRRSSPAGPGSGCGARHRCPPPTWPGTARVVEAFLAAARGGDLGRAARGARPRRRAHGRPPALPAGASTVARGARTVATETSGSGGGPGTRRTALVDGSVGVIVVVHGRLVLALTVRSTATGSPRTT